jgi:hypothetical protein
MLGQGRSGFLPGVRVLVCVKAALAMAGVPHGKGMIMIGFLWP